MEARQTDLKKKIERGVERLLIVDDETVPLMQEKIKEYRQELQAVEADLKTAKVPATLLRDQEQDRVEAAMAKITRLDELLTSNDPKRVRTILAELIERIDIKVEKRPPKKEGGRIKYVLKSGEIHFINPVQLVHSSSQRGGLS